MWILIIISFLIAGCATPAKQMDLETQKLRTQIGTLEQQLKESEKEIENLEAQLEKERQIRRDLEKQLWMKKKTLEETKTLRKPSIRNIQTALRKAGFYDGPVDGKLGPRTRQAIKDFQKSKGLKADGIVGRKTWQELSKYLEEVQK